MVMDKGVMDPTYESYDMTPWTHLVAMPSLHTDLSSKVIYIGEEMLLNQAFTDLLLVS